MVVWQAEDGPGRGDRRMEGGRGRRGGGGGEGGEGGWEGGEEKPQL